MKYLDEYRDATVAKALIGEINRIATRHWCIMEVCGGQTHSIIRHGIDQLLPRVELLHGPGCPVCVTPLEMIDRAHAIAMQPGVIFCSFGDMLRVPGSHTDLLRIKAAGHDVRIVYSPLDAVEYAAANPQRRVVFFAIGFETTAPANAMSVWLAKQRSLTNFSVLVSQVLVPPSITAILQTPGNRVQAFLGPGHVCAVMGTSEYQAIVNHYHVPIVIAGFEPVDLLESILMAVQQLEAGRTALANQYVRAVRREGNPASLKLLAEVFFPCDRKWRGIGTIAKSGLTLRPPYRQFDAEYVFDVQTIQTLEARACISGEILKGLKKPPDCAAYGTRCTPSRPLGATMVSSEGACAAYYHHGRHKQQGSHQHTQDDFFADNGAEGVL